MAVRNAKEITTALDKYFLNLAGEYRVAAELLKREIFTTITYGNKKGADLYAIGSARTTAVIEVNASNSDRFVTGFYQKYDTETKEHPDYWVLYSLKKDGSEDFFVLSHAEMAQVQAQRNRPGKVGTWDEHAASAKTGVDNVLAKDLTSHRDTWSKITDFCNPTPAS